MSEANRRKNSKSPPLAPEPASSERESADTLFTDAGGESKYLHTGTFRVAHKAIARLYTFKCAALLDFLFQMALAYGSSRGGCLWVQVLQTKMAEELDVSLSTLKRMIELLEDDQNGPRVVEVRKVRGQGKHPSSIYRIDRRALKIRLKALEKADEQKERKALEDLIDQSTPRVRGVRKSSSKGVRTATSKGPSSSSASIVGADDRSSTSTSQAAGFQNTASAGHEASCPESSDIVGSSVGEKPSAVGHFDLPSQVKMTDEDRSKRAAITGQNAALRREVNRNPTDNTSPVPEAELPSDVSPQQAQDVVVPFFEYDVAPPLPEDTGSVRTEGDGSSTYAPITSLEHSPTAAHDHPHFANAPDRPVPAKAESPRAEVEAGSEEDVRILALRLISLGMDERPSFAMARRRPEVVRRQLEFWRYRPEASNPDTDVPAFLRRAIEKDWGCRQWAAAQKTEAQIAQDRIIAEERRQRIAQEEERRRLKTEIDIENRAEMLRLLADLPTPIQEALNNCARWEAGERWKFKGLAQGILADIVDQFCMACRRHAPSDTTDSEWPGSTAALAEICQLYSSDSIAVPIAASAAATPAPCRTKPYDPVENWAALLRNKIRTCELRAEEITLDFLQNIAPGLTVAQIESVRAALAKMLLQEEAGLDSVG